MGQAVLVGLSAVVPEIVHGTVYFVSRTKVSMEYPTRYTSGQVNRQEWRKKIGPYRN